MRARRRRPHLIVGTVGQEPVRSLWLEQALACEDAPPSAALEGEKRCDVCIVGGGYVGLWTALALAERDAALRIVVIDADICGGGASGRNTGQALPLWSKVDSMLHLFGADDALWLGRESEAAIQAIRRLGESEGGNIEFEQCGWLWLASSKAQMGTWAGAVRASEKLGVDAFRPVTAEEARDRTGSSTYLGGVFIPSAATLQPAKLGRTLRQAVIRRGVEVFEHTRMRHLDRGKGRSGRRAAVSGRTR